MKKNNYNIDDEQYKEVIESLKKLPRVDAPPDFEMNLKRKLNSLKFQEKEDKRGFFYYFSLKRPIIPAAAAAALAVVAFLFISRQPEVENPFTKLPPERHQIQNQSADNGAVKGGSGKNYLIDPGNISSDDVVKKKETRKNISKQPVQKENFTPQRNEDDQIASTDKPSNRRLRDLDFGGFGSDLDKSLRAKPDPNGGSRLGDWGESSSNANFGGFNLVPGPDREMDLLRARMDSLRRFWLKGNK